MKIVEQATHPPAQCIVTADQDGPFIDTETWANWRDPYVYLHVPLVEYMARELLGMVPRAEVDELRARIDSYEQEIEGLQEFVAASEKLEIAQGSVLNAP